MRTLHYHLLVLASIEVSTKSNKKLRIAALKHDSCPHAGGLTTAAMQDSRTKFMYLTANYLYSTMSYGQS